MANASNLCMLIGNIGKDPESRTVGTYTVCTFSIAVKKFGKEGNNTQWVGVEIWGKKAETALQYLKKGAKISIVGELCIDSFEVKGEKKTKTYIKADDFSMLDKKKEDSSSGDSGGVAEDNSDDKDLPF